MQVFYEWGIYLGIFLAALYTLYLFIDSRNRAYTSGKIVWLLSLLGLLLTLPLLYFRLTADQPDNSAVFDQPSFRAFLILALGGFILILLALWLHIRRRREPEPAYQTPVYTPPPLVEIPITPQVTVKPPAVDASPAPTPRPTEVLNRHTGPMAWLIDTENGHLFRASDDMSIGSGAENDVILDDSAVSGYHARLKLENGQFTLFDLASTNGTEVNGAAITRHVLADGDRVQIGRKSLVFKAIGSEVINRPGQLTQPLRLDVAVPGKVVLHNLFGVVVAVKQIDAQRLKVSGLNKVKSEPFKVNKAVDGSPMKLTASIHALNCRIVGPSFWRFLLFPDSDSPELPFTLEPMVLGKILIQVMIIQSFDTVIGSAHLGVHVRDQLVGTAETSVMSLPIQPFDNLSSDRQRRGLYDFINEYFSLPEISNLCFKMDIDPDEIRGSQKSEKIRQLILYCLHRDRQEELVDHVIEERPNMYDKFLASLGA